MDTFTIDFADGRAPETIAADVGYFNGIAITGREGRSRYPVRPSRA